MNAKTVHSALSCEAALIRISGFPLSISIRPDVEEHVAVLVGENLRRNHYLKILDLAKRHFQNLNVQVLELRKLATGEVGITPAFGAAIAEAAGVCLESQSHIAERTFLTIKSFSPSSDLLERQAQLTWPTVTLQALQCWKDETSATEHGAVAVAILVVQNILGKKVVERSYRGTGFDYWLGETNESDDLFEKKERLEISGIRAGDPSVLRRRIAEKEKQTQRSDGIYPAIVIVIEFGQPLGHISRR